MTWKMIQINEIRNDRTFDLVMALDGFGGGTADGIKSAHIF